MAAEPKKKLHVQKIAGSGETVWPGRFRLPASGEKSLFDSSRLTKRSFFVIIHFNPAGKNLRRKELDMRRQLRRTLICLTLLALLAGVTPVPAAGFQDVPDGHWATDSIRRSVSLGFLQGQSATRFGVGEEMTRAAFAEVLCRFYGWKTSGVKTASFQDVPAEARYAGAVETLLARGVLTKQRPDFRPDSPLTREDLAVMLVRSMGYSALAGLAQELPTSFQDVHTNGGYIALAYNLGLMNGTSAGVFSPSRAAPREEVAVTLVRLYDKLHAGLPKVTAVISAPGEGETAPDMTGLDAAAISVGRLMGVGNRPSLTAFMPADAAAALRDEAKKAGVTVLLHITGGPSALDAPEEEIIRFLAEAVSDGGYDGLLLDMPEVKRERRKDLTHLVNSLRTALGEELLLYMAVDAPVWNGREYGGYDYTAIAAVADQMILRVASYEGDREEAFPIAPVDPLEEVYYALTSMKGHVELSRLSLLVTTSPSVWDMNSRPLDLNDEELAAALAAGQQNYSQRYGCAYMDTLDGEGNPVAIWYLDGEAIQMRRQLTQAFGIQNLCLSDWRDAPLDLLA